MQGASFPERVPPSECRSFIRIYFKKYGTVIWHRSTRKQRHHWLNKQTKKETNLSHSTSKIFGQHLWHPTFTVLTQFFGFHGDLMRQKFGV